MHEIENVHKETGTDQNENRSSSLLFLQCRNDINN